MLHRNRAAAEADLGCDGQAKAQSRQAPGGDGGDAGEEALVAGDVAIAGQLNISGNAGMGTASPVRRLHVAGNGIRLEHLGKRLDLSADGGAVDLDSTTNDLYIKSSGPSGNNDIIMQPFGSNGNVGIGTTNPDVRLHVASGTDTSPTGMKSAKR